MSKVVTLSRNFQANHPRAGEPTYFVEKVMSSFCNEEDLKGNTDNEVFLYYCELSDQLDLMPLDDVSPKHHTIRAGKRWKDGDTASLRVWSGKPYRSPQIVIAPDVTLRVVDIEITEHWHVKINGDVYCNSASTANEFLTKLSANDGLLLNDFYSWFRQSLPFTGQILIWSKADLRY